MEIADQDLTGKDILEVGSGRGGTTRKLVDVLSRRPGASLIVTDISDIHFQRLREEFQGKQIPIRLICTKAQELEGVAAGSVDCLVCNYTLCAVDAEAGQAALALKRFREVLRDGGRLLVEEEFPISHAHSPRQEVWAEKMPDHKTFPRYTFRDYTGYIVAPWLPGVGHQHVTIRHSAGVTPWKDRDTHLHTDSEECYFVFQGELHVLVDGAVLTLKPHAVLMDRAHPCETPTSRMTV